MKELATISNHDTLAEQARKHLLRGLPNEQATVLLAVCERYSLDPILKHAILIAGNLYITRDGLLHVAHASGQFDGMSVETGTDENGDWAECTVYRRDMQHPFKYRVYRSEYDSHKGAWQTHPNSMLIKVAEVFALRRAFPVGIVAYEEMERVIEREYSVEVIEPAPVPPKNGGKKKSDMRVQIVREHAEKIGVDYGQVRAVFQQAGANGNAFDTLADEFLACQTPDDFITWSLQYEPVPEI